MVADAELYRAAALLRSMRQHAALHYVCRCTEVLAMCSDAKAEPWYIAQISVLGTG
jgi:hypothetical protein